jgi:hypothetical protein
MFIYGFATAFELGVGGSNRMIADVSPATSTQRREEMTINEGLRLMAGFFVLLSIALGYWVHPAWYLFTAFVGLNLLQSAFSRWCPMMWILKKLGLREG